MEREPLQYDQILYNQVVFELERNWNRKLTEHEKNVLIYGYRFGRMIESEKQDLR